MRPVVECSKSRKNPHGFDPNSKALAVQQQEALRKHSAKV